MEKSCVEYVRRKFGNEVKSSQRYLKKLSNERKVILNWTNENIDSGRSSTMLLLRGYSEDLGENWDEMTIETFINEINLGILFDFLKIHNFYSIPASISKTDVIHLLIGECCKLVNMDEDVDSFLSVFCFLLTKCGRKLKEILKSQNKGSLPKISPCTPTKGSSLKRIRTQLLNPVQNSSMSMPNQPIMKKTFSLEEYEDHVVSTVLYWGNLKGEIDLEFLVQKLEEDGVCVNGISGILRQNRSRRLEYISNLSLLSGNSNLMKKGMRFIPATIRLIRSPSNKPEIPVFEQLVIVPYEVKKKKKKKRKKRNKVNNSIVPPPPTKPPEIKMTKLMKCHKGLIMDYIANHGKPTDLRGVTCVDINEMRAYFSEAYCINFSTDSFGSIPQRLDEPKISLFLTKEGGLLLYNRSEEKTKKTKVTGKKRKRKRKRKNKNNNNNNKIQLGRPVESEILQRNRKKRKLNELDSRLSDLFQRKVEEEVQKRVNEEFSKQVDHRVNKMVSEIVRSLIDMEEKEKKEKEKAEQLLRHQQLQQRHHHHPPTSYHHRHYQHHHHRHNEPIIYM